MSRAANPYEAELRTVLARLKHRLTGNELQQTEELAKRASAETAGELELILVRHLSLDELREHVATLRERWMQLTGAVAKSTSSLESEPALRAVAEELAAQISRRRWLNDNFEAERHRLASRVLQVSLLLAALGVVGIVRNYAWELNTVVLAGAAGGLTSCLRRVYTAQPGNDAVAAIDALNASRISLSAAPVLGAIFAMILHLCFVGGLIKGVLFPELKLEGGDQATQMAAFITGTVKGTAPDFAKLILWAFIAGFAERFVPDLLTSFVSKADTKGGAQ